MQSYVFARKRARFLPAFVGSLLGVMLALMLSPAQATDEIVVKSSPLADNLSDIISTTHILTTEDINKLSGAPIGRVLNNLAGVSVAAYGPAVGRPVIRGLTGYRLAVLQNGMLPGDVSPTAEDHANGDMTFDTSRIEVLKGPSALRYGAYSATGVVNSFSRHLDSEGAATTDLQLSTDTASD
ncbi:MAG: Plug domain-containing protein, partial [Alphaproteobacteria bacterium]|nr:Plug domain-containing protein [Alphaproteobacteria bacterium]